MDVLPTNKEIHKTIGQHNNTASRVPGIRAEIHKALVTDPDTFVFVGQFVHKCWLSEKPPMEFDTGCLSILPMKDDLPLPGNYRGILMLGVGQKSPQL
eukprot:3521810-Ditylum_brightwellii.AAC.1